MWAPAALVHDKSTTTVGESTERESPGFSILSLLPLTFVCWGHGRIQSTLSSSPFSSPPEASNGGARPPRRRSLVSPVFPRVRPSCPREGMSGMEIGGGMDRSSGPSGGGSSLPSPSPSPTAASTAPALVLSNSGRKIEQSAKKKYVKQVTGRHNDTDMHLAAQRGDLVAVRQILSDIDSQMIGTAGGAEFDAMVAEIRAAVVSEVNERGETALMIAAEKGYLDAVEELLKHADRESVARRSISGFDALHVAAKEGHQAVVQALLNYDPELSKTVGPSSVTPVMSAARNGHLAVVEELLSRNPSLLELTMTNGKNALHLAARYAHAEVVRALLSRNTQLARGIDKKRQTAVHMAAKGESTEVVNLLLAAAPETATQEDKFSNTALHVATRKKRVEIMKELLRVVASGGGVNALNRDGKTAMDLAEGLQASEETASIKELLAAYGGLRAAELNQQSAMGDELRKTVTEIKKDVHTQLEQTWKTNKNVSGIAKELRKLHREGINNATNSVTVVAVLFATVAFAAVFTVPGGNTTDGVAVAAGYRSFKIFFVFNALALFTSLAVVVVQITLVRGETKSERRVVGVINKLMWLAAVCTSVAFIASSYIVVGRRFPWAAVLVTSIGAAIMGSVLGMMTFYVVKSKRSRSIRRKVRSGGGGGSTTSNRRHPDYDSDFDGFYAL